MSKALGAKNLKLRITPAAERALRSGHPWVFSDSIVHQNREGSSGDLAIIYDKRNRFLAIGLYDPDSPLRVRVLKVGKPEPITSAWWQARLDQALDRRRGLFDEHTTGFRCINGESDGWPGLVLDRYENTLVLKLYTAAWMPRLEEICDLIQEKLKPHRLVLRLSRNIQASVKTTSEMDDGQVLRGGPVAAPVIFHESGLRFEADVIRGQKTGFFLDQRENRRKVASLAQGRTVLNAFSFTGGFSVYAASGGAKAVTDLDISAHALAGAKRNFDLNRSITAIATCRHETIQADAFEWLAENHKRKFELIILDPPSLAKRESEVAGALKAYLKLVTLAINHLADRGILVACSCSAHVGADAFFETVQRTAAQSGRPFTKLETTGHPPDHPATFKEANYLKAIYLLAL